MNTFMVAPGAFPALCGVDVTVRRSNHDEPVAKERFLP